MSLLQRGVARPVRWLAPVAAHLHELDAGPRQFLVFLFFNVMSWQCLVGPILVLHGRAIGIDRAAVGGLHSMLYFAGALGLLTKAVAERYGSKRVLMTGWTLRNLLVLPVVLTPWVYAHLGSHAAAVLLFITAALFCITRAMAGIAWSSWLHEIVPAQQLGRFFAAETALTRLLAVCFGVFAFFVLGRHPPLTRFALVAAVGVTAGLVSIRTLRRVPGGAPPVRQNGAPNDTGFGRVLRDRSFMSFLGTTALFGFAFAGQGLLITLMLRDQLQLGAGLILLLTTFGNALAIPTSTRWRRVADRHGSPAVMAAAGALTALCLVGLGFLRPGHAPLPFVALICALVPVAESGHYVAASRGYMLRMQPDLRHASNAVWSTGTSVLGGVSAILMGLWLSADAPSHFTTAAWAYAIIMLAAVLVCLRVPAPVADRGSGQSAIHDPSRPISSLGRTLAYVLRPARSRVGLAEGHGAATGKA